MNETIKGEGDVKKKSVRIKRYICNQGEKKEKEVEYLITVFDNNDVLNWERQECHV